MTTIPITDLDTAIEALHAAVDITVNGAAGTADDYTETELAAAAPYLELVDEDGNCYGLEFSLPSGHRVVFGDFDPDTGVWCAEAVYPGSPAAVNVYAAWSVLDPAGTVVCAYGAPLDVAEDPRLIPDILRTDIESGTPFVPDQD